ncbi:MAG: Eco57I restriction-modification methylase domain-containing protein, partial [Chloroflexi bacterium]|nr:Eco57I restriction-modification methylase domain-containing protein [Chloroflexota bacterium]
DGFARETTEKLANWNPYDQNASADFFDPEWMFGIREGFDIVIGNPPYVRQEAIKEFKPRLQAQGYECFNGIADLYVYFFERGVKLLKRDGLLCYISSNSFLNSGFAEGLRSFLQQHTRLHLLIDFAETGVFTAITEPCIILVSRGGQPNEAVRLLKWNENDPVDQVPVKAATCFITLPQKEFRSDGWRLESPAVLRLLEKLRAAGKPLGEYVNGRFYYGIKTGLNEAFVVDRATRDRLIAEHKSSAEVLKPFLRGRDIKRWRVEPQDLWLIFTRRGINIKKYPAIYEHLLPFKKRLMPGAPGGRKPGSYEWYEIQDNIAYWQEFEQPKIVYQDIARYFGMAWDDSGSYLANTCYFIPRAAKWLLATLLSSAMQFYVRKVIGSDEGGFIRLFSIHVEKFPIPSPSRAEHDALVKLVERILAAKRADAAADVSAWEREIDERVYRLYGLTPAEIKIVEEGGRKG